MSPPHRLHAAALGASLALTASVGTSQTVPPAPTTAAGRTMLTLDQIAATQTTGRYTHSTRVDPRTGRYEWDCSAMAAWVLRRSAPRALATIHSTRPLAVDFYRAIIAAPASETAPRRGAWSHVTRLANARPGDVLAWPRPRWFPSHNTGHVAFVAAPPIVVPGGVLVQIIDATSVPHADDSRTATGQTGFGRGTLRITTDPVTGEGTAYGWIGAQTPADWMIATPVVIGRVWH